MIAVWSGRVYEIMAAMMKTIRVDTGCLKGDFHSAGTL